MRPLILGPLAALLFSGSALAETFTITGVMTGADHQTYREVPFHVPAGTTAITVEFAYTGKDQKSVIDLGIRDPARFRGWSGGNKASFTLTETWATPSYLPGPLPAGDWKLILGVPNLRKDGRAEYAAKITLADTPAFHGFTETPLKAEPGWYRGDLHLHTQHSDGSCPSRGGKRVPCPTFKTLEAAAGRGLDFVAMTDHNTSAHFHDLAELQPYYDDLLVIPGREVTTFYGHANVLGMTAPLDFQLGSGRAPDLNAILSQAEKAGGLISLNHPALPSGEACMGCGWTAKADFDRIPAIEAINGTNATGPLSGVAYWEKRLSNGHRITAIGGSDNHDATLTGLRSVGVPTTVVHADNLSQDAILAGIRAGHVFVDALGTKDRLLEVTAQTTEAKAQMGDVLPTAKDALVRLHIRVRAAAGGKVVVRSDEPKFVPPNPIPVESDDATTDVAFGVDGKRHWVRVDVLGPDGALWLLGNPVYLRGR